MNAEDIDVTLSKLLGGKDVACTLLGWANVNFVFGNLSYNTVVPRLFQFFEAELIGGILGSQSATNSVTKADTVSGR